MIEEPEQDAPPITELNKGQRRVLGTLLEKAFTTPEAYPLTVKALTAGCNQKSNRHPLTEYSEDDVLEVLDQLRQMGLVAVVHTETGRTERFRHYMRKRFTFSEPQLAVLTELLLRGRQSIGDLRARPAAWFRSRASTNCAWPSADCWSKNTCRRTRASSAAASRSITISTVPPRTRNSPGTPDLRTKTTGAAAACRRRAHAAAESHTPSTSAPPLRGPHVAEVSASAAVLTQLRDENRELHARIDSLEHEVSRLKGLVDDLVRDLRG